MDDQLIPAYRILLGEQKTAHTSKPKSTKSVARQTLIGDWHFESSRNFHRSLPIDRLVGQSRTMMGLRARVIRYAETDETVLIIGETGTGKELIANILHDLSSRRNFSFVPVNCAAIPEALAESEFFGNTRGAYTGAVQCRDGLLSRADGGTLFLDEFGELSREVQSKLLRALEFGTYRPVGSNREKRADTRIIAATNRDLEESVHRGEFRADLYYRINVLQIVAPPLRKHRTDIPQIVGKILGELLPANSNIRITESVMAELIHAPWSGNVRELKNVLRRSLVMASGGVIDRLECDLYSGERNHAAARDYRAPVGKLISILTRNKGHLEATAHELNVSVRTVQRRIKESGLRLRDFRNI